MQPDVMRPSAELFDADRSDGRSLELPAKEPDLPAGEHPLGRVDVLERRLDGQERRDLQVREEPEERLGAGNLVEPLHAEVLERRERVDHDARVAASRDLAAEHLLERGDRDLDARQLGRPPDDERHLAERRRRSDRRDVLERDALVPHHVGDRVEHFDAFELGAETVVVQPRLVRGFFQRDEERALSAPHPFAEELEGEGRFAGTRRAHDEVRPTGDDPPFEHRIHAGVARGDPDVDLPFVSAFRDRGGSPCGAVLSRRSAARVGCAPPLQVVSGERVGFGEPRRRKGYHRGTPDRGVPSAPPAPLGSIRMRAIAATLPAQLRDGFRAGEEIAPAPTGRSATVFAVGVGGSAISADLARGIVEAETPVVLSLVRSSELPRAVERRSRVVLASYSGDTWETLRAYDQAGRVGASRVVVTSGGSLGERAERDGVAVVRLPPGLPPRSAVGHAFGAILGLLDPWFPESNENRMGRAAELVSSLLPRYARPSGPAATIARRIGSRLPVVYAEPSFSAVARRWKTQIEENAKRLAMFDELPEVLHNAIVGWDATPRTEAARFSVVLLRWPGSRPLLQRSSAFLERLLKQRGAGVVPVPLVSEDRLEALVAALALGDYVSLFLADQRRVDPYPIDAIQRLKSSMAGKSPR
jgi:glucose/mannose-6-phosphate isomerase